MRCATTKALAALLASQAPAISLAAPTPQDGDINIPVEKAQSSSLEDVMKRQSTDKDRWCGKAGDLRKWDDAEEAYMRVRPDLMIAHIVKGADRDDWLGRFEKEIYEDDSKSRKGASNCGLLHEECDPGDGGSCNDFYDVGEEHGDDGEDKDSLGHAYKQAYWVFETVKGAHNKINTMYERLRDGTTINSLKLGSTIEAFDLKGGNAFEGALGSLLTGGLGLAGGLAGATGNPATSFGATVFSTLLSGIDLGFEGDGEIKVSEMQEGLADVFTSWRRGLNQTMQYALGGGKEDGDFEGLPDLSYKQGHDSHIGRFFGTPFWLLDNDSELVKDTMEVIEKSVSMKMVDIVLQAGNWKVVGDHLIKSKDDCYKHDHRRWIEGSGGDHWCFYMFKGDVPDASIEDTMVEQGIESLQDFMETAIDCARNGESGVHDIDPSDTVFIGGNFDRDIPRCFFSTPVYKTVQPKYQGGGGGLTGDNAGPDRPLEKMFDD